MKSRHSIKRLGTVHNKGVFTSLQILKHAMKTPFGEELATHQIKLLIKHDPGLSNKKFEKTEKCRLRYQNICSNIHQYFPMHRSFSKNVLSFLKQENMEMKSIKLLLRTGKGCVFSLEDTLFISADGEFKQCHDYFLSSKYSEMQKLCYESWDRKKLNGSLFSST